MPQVAVLPDCHPVTLRRVPPQGEKRRQRNRHHKRSGAYTELTSRELTADGALPFANPCLTLCRHFGWRELQRGCRFGQLFKPGRQRDICHRIHPVAGWDRILESRRNHKLEEFLRQLWLLAGSGAGGDFHLQIVTFAEVRGGVVIFLLFENVISRRGGVTQDQIAFTF